MKITVQQVSQQETVGPIDISDTGTGAAMPAPKAVSVVPDDTITFPPPSKLLGAEQLYPDDDASYVAHVLNLLRQSKAALNESLKADPKTQFNDFENQVMLATALVEKAQKSREIGSGFTAIVNAIYWGLVNRGAETLTKKQVLTLIEGLNRLLWAPYLHFDTAMSVVDSLEDVELDIESPDLKVVIAELDV